MINPLSTQPLLHNKSSILRLEMMKLTEDELVRRALETYIAVSHPSGHYDIEEFREDYQRFGYVIKLIGIFLKRSQLNVRLILNHVTILYNEFGTKATEFLVHAAFHKAPETIPSLKSLLQFFHRIPESGVVTVFGEPVSFNKYQANMAIIEAIEIGISNDISGE